MRLALAQVNVVVGDLDGNVARIVDAVADAERAGADLVVLPELAITGYPPEDLLLRPGFVRAARQAVDEVARACTGTVALVGAPAFDRDLANAAFVCANGSVHAVYRKHFLPNYGVFDEHRYFAPGRELPHSAFSVRQTSNPQRLPAPYPLRRCPLRRGCSWMLETRSMSQIRAPTG